MSREELTPATRPRSIQASQWLLVLIAAAGAVGVANGMVALSHLAGVEDRLLAMPLPADLNVDAVAGGLSFAVKASTVLDLLCLIVVGTLAWLLHRGEHQTRVVTWVVCAVIALGELVELAADGGQYSAVGSPAGNDPAFAHVYRLVGELLPGWYLPVYYVVELVCLVSAIVVVALLLSHGARDFYDRNRPSTPADRARVWDTSRVRRVRPGEADRP